jgi:hypothetical protein
MQATDALTLIVMGYALALTMVVLLVAARRQPQTPTVVIQQAPESRDSYGCGSIILFALIAVGLVVFIGAFGGY